VCSDGSFWFMGGWPTILYDIAVNFIGMFYGSWWYGGIWPILLISFDPSTSLLLSIATIGIPPAQHETVILLNFNR
jgi:hypothetical protein